MKYVKINRSRQLALDGIVDTDKDSTSNDAVSSRPYHLLFPSAIFLLLVNTSSYKTPIMYFE